MNHQSTELDFVSRKSVSDRYIYTVKKIADFEEGWGLYNDGWALTGGEDSEFFPIWPSQEAAMRCATDSWSEYKPAPIAVDYLMEELLPMLESDTVKVAIFMVPDQSETATKMATEFRNDLANELEKYE